jgi:hypothetical protein
VKVAHLTTVDLSLRFLVFAQLKAIRDQGHDVIGISAPGPWVADLEREGIRHIALASSTRAMNPGADARSALELWQVLRRERPDVLHTHTPQPGVYGRIVGRLAGVPPSVPSATTLVGDTAWVRPDASSPGHGSTTQVLSEAGEDVELGQRARAHCLQDFGFDRVVDEWASLLSVFQPGAHPPTCSGPAAPPTLTARGVAEPAPVQRAGPDHP